MRKELPVFVRKAVCFAEQTIAKIKLVRNKKEKAEKLLLLFSPQQTA